MVEQVVLFGEGQFLVGVGRLVGELPREDPHPSKLAGSQRHPPHPKHICNKNPSRFPSSGGFTLRSLLFYLSGNRNITKELQGTPWKHTSWPWATGRRVATRSCAPRGPGPSPPRGSSGGPCCVPHPRPVATSSPTLLRPLQRRVGGRIANKSISNSDIVNICNYNNSSSYNNNSNNM